MTDTAEPEERARPTLHRAVSAWAVSTLCAALLAAVVAGAAVGLTGWRGVSSFTGAALLVALAVAAPVEGAAAVARRGTRAPLGILVLVPPTCALVLLVVGDAWVEAFVLGDLPGSLERTSRRLAALGPSAARVLGPWALLGLALAPLTTSRGAAKSALVTCAAAAAAPAVLTGLLVVAELVGGRRDQPIQLRVWAPTALVTLCVAAGAAGLCLGERLEARLAGWLTRRLRGDA